MSITIDPKSLFEKAFDNFKKTTPLLLVLSISTALVLFLPNPILEKMALASLPDVWRRIIGIVFIVSLSLNIVIMFFEIYDKGRARRIRKRFRRKLIKLPTEYKKTLIKILDSKERCMDMNPYSGNTIYLKNGGYILSTQSSTFVEDIRNITLKYSPQPWLVDLYDKEPELFK